MSFLPTVIWKKGKTNKKVQGLGAQPKGSMCWDTSGQVLCLSSLHPGHLLTPGYKGREGQEPAQDPSGQRLTIWWSPRKHHSTWPLWTNTEETKNKQTKKTLSSKRESSWVPSQSRPHGFSKYFIRVPDICLNINYKEVGKWKENVSLSLSINRRFSAFFYILMVNRKTILETSNNWRFPSEKLTGATQHTATSSSGGNLSTEVLTGSGQGQATHLFGGDWIDWIYSLHLDLKWPWSFHAKRRAWEVQLVSLASKSDTIWFWFPFPFLIPISNPLCVYTH